MSRPIDTAAGQSRCNLFITQEVHLPASSMLNEVPRIIAAGDGFE
jgi:hypothetical protein